VNEGIVHGGAVEIAYRRYGDGPDTVVVLHGGPGLHAGYLEADLASLAETRTVIFYDQRGGGRSTVPTDPSELDATWYVDDLEHIRMHFGLQSLVLVGHSWGGLLAGLYAQARPDHVRRLLLVDPDPPKRDPFWSAISARFHLNDDERGRLGVLMERWRAAAARDPATASCRAYWDLYLRGYFHNPAKQQRMRGDLCTESLQTLLGAHRGYTRESLGAWDLTSALPQFGFPTLVIHGRNDPVPLDGSRLWAQSLPNARLLIIEVAGHFPYIEQPEEFFAAADAFLNGAWPPTAQQLGGSVSMLRADPRH
jgi:proline iminopeptidase